VVHGVLDAIMLFVGAAEAAPTECFANKHTRTDHIHIKLLLR